MNGKKIFSYFFAIFFISSFFIIPGIALAVDPPPTQTGSYTLLAPLPIGEGGSNTNTVALGGEVAFQNYLNSAFKIGITIAILLAVIMIVIGGIEWMGESVFGKESGKKKITGALTGMVLALAIFLILNTINPNLVNLRLSVDPLTKPPDYVPTGSTPIGISDTALASVFTGDTTARASLMSGCTPRTDSCVTLNASACTSTAQTSGCTNIGGLPTKSIEDLKALAIDCRGCDVIVTGGTEYWQHAGHGPGKAVVDLRPTASLNTFLATKNPAASNPISGTKVRWGSATFTYENTGDNGRATAPHWHVTNI